MNAMKQLMDLGIFGSACHRMFNFKLSRFIASFSALAVMLVGGTTIASSQTAYFSGAQTTVASGFASPTATAVDSSGNVYVADLAHNAIKEILAVNGSIPASPTVRTLGGAFNAPIAVAVDGNGNVYVASSDGTVKQMLAVGGSIPASPVVVTITQIAGPQGLAVDARGDLYVSGGCGGQVPPGFPCGFVEEFLAVSGTVHPGANVVLLSLSVSGPGGVAVDASGNVYVADTGNSQVDEVLATNGNVTIYSGIRGLVNLPGPGALAIDRAGNLFVSLPASNAVDEIHAANGSNSISTVGTGFSLPFGVAVDGNENLYVADFTNNRVVDVSLSGANFGSVAVGTTSPAVTLSFTFATAGKLGSTAVLTQGIAGLDFASAGTGSCTANTTYAVGQTCTVSVTFTPRAAGVRNGAALLYGSGGNVLATGYVQGTGVAPQINFLPATQSAVYTGSSSIAPQAVAVDSAGNVYIGTGGATGVLKESPSSGTYTSAGSVGTNLASAEGVAIDGAGNLYVADTIGNAVYKETPTSGGYTQSTIGNGLSQPRAVAVDSSGNVYISDGSGQVYKESLTVSGYSQSAIPTTGLSSPGGVAVDGSGNVYIADVYNGRVVEETISQGSYSQSTVVSGLAQPQGIAVDSGGNVYVADLQNNQILKETSTPGGYVQTTVADYASNGVLQPTGVAVDSSGNVYIAQAQNFQVIKENSSNPPTLTFANAAVGATSPDSPQIVTVENIGNAAAAFPIPSTGNNPSIAASFTLNSSIASACPLTTANSSTAGTLAAGASCQLPISFAPATPGSASGSLVLTDTNLNAAAPAYISQSIALSGTGIQVTPTLSWAAPAAITYGTPLTATQLNATSSVAGTFSYSVAAGAILGAGQQTLTATFTPTDTVDYTTATATVSLTVNQATPAVTWASPAGISYGTALSAAQLNAASTVAGTFAYSSALGTILSAGPQTLTATFTPTDAADYTAATATVSLTVSPAAPAITWASPASISYGAPLSATQLNATSTVAGSFAYSPATGTILTAGSHTLSATFTPADTTDYAPSTATVTLTVSKTMPAITWPTPAAITYGAALSATQLKATSPVTGNFTYSPAAGTVLSVGSQTLNVTFTPTDSTDYTTATASVVLTVNPAPSFTLAASPASLSIAQGASGTSSLTVTGHNGFTGSATLTVSGLPSGVTASFSPNPTAGSSVLTLTAGSSVVPGTYALTVTGTSSSLTATTPIALTITAAPSAFACHVVYSVTSQWGGGFGTAVTINNTGTKAITNWTLTWTFANGQTVSQIWNGNLTQSGANVTVTNLSYNGSISAGGSYTGMGFNGTWNNKTNATPTSFSVNGTVCK